MRILKAFLVFLLAVAFIGIASLLQSQVSTALGKKPEEPKDDSAARPTESKEAGGFQLSFGYDEYVPTVEVAEARTQSIAQFVSAPGTLSPGSDVSVGADFAGTVLGLAVDEGDEVKEGDLIFALDATDKEEALAEAEVSLALKEIAAKEAAAELADASRKLQERIDEGEPSTVRESRLALRKSEISEQQSQARLESADSALKRAELLQKKGLGTEVEVESARAEHKVANLSLDIASKDLQLARDSLQFQIDEAAKQLRDLKKARELAELAVQRATKDLEVARITLARAKRELAKCKVTAPISGLVTMRNINSGEAVNRNDASSAATSHYIISDFSRMFVYADVDEGDIIKVEKGQPVEVQVNALGDDKLVHGKVYDIGNRATVDGETIYFRVKVLLEDHPPALRPGMTGNVEIETARVNEVVCVPIQAIGQRRRRELTKAGIETEGRGGDVVDVVFVAKEGKAELRVVQVGIADTDKVEVKSGLKAGEQIISGPYRTLEELAPGDPVKVEVKERRGDGEAGPGGRSGGKRGGSRSGGRSGGGKRGGGEGGDD